MSPARPVISKTADARIAHAGHVPGSPLAQTGSPDVHSCAGRYWIVALDSERLRHARKKAALSQERLAYEAGVSITTVANLERQARPRCHFRTRARIAAALGAHPKAISAAPESTRMAEIITAAPGDRASGPGQTCTRTFPGRPDQVRQARVFLRGVLTDCPVADDALLICSELAANAVQHSDSARPGGQFTLRAEIRDGDYAWIEVEDQGGRWVTTTRPDQRGRGLRVVDKVAAYWDIRGDNTGRVICAQLDWPR
jgi:serine/threonine-protein kinase RsbW